MLVGYARVSTTEQETALQTDALSQAKVTRVYVEKRSAVKQRPQLQAAIESLQPGSCLVVYKLDRLARSLSDLLRLIEAIQARGASIKSLTEPIDTTTAAGRMTIQLLGVFAEFERSMIRERSKAGSEAARARGINAGRPRLLSEAEEEEALKLINAGTPKASIARIYGVSPQCVRNTELRKTNPNAREVKRKFPEIEPRRYQNSRNNRAKTTENSTKKASKREAPKSPI